MTTKVRRRLTTLLCADLHRPAVNLAARIEKLCSQLERTILASDEFAEHCPGKFAPVGNFDLRGIDGRRTVFGLEGEAVLANR